MCIIGICHDRYLTDIEAQNCFNGNSDGTGMAWCLPEGKVRVRKGFMTLEEFLDFYDEFKMSPEFIPHVVHFRTQTSGDVSREMTHPFKISPMSELAVEEDTECSVLFHNGVMGDWKTLLVNLVSSGQIPGMPKGPMNDTRVAAIMASLPNVGDEILEVLSGKFVKVQPDGKIIRWGHFESENGILFSNTGYKYAIYRYNGKNSCLAGNYNNNGVGTKTGGNKSWQQGKFRGKDLKDLTDEEWQECCQEEWPECKQITGYTAP